MKWSSKSNLFPHGAFIILATGSTNHNWCTFQIWGVSRSEDRGGGDNSIQIINFGRVGDESFKEWPQKIGGGGGRVGDNNILTFLSYCTR